MTGGPKERPPDGRAHAPHGAVRVLSSSGGPKERPPDGRAHAPHGAVRVLIAIIYVLPRRALSRFVGRLARIRSRTAVRLFARLVSVDMSEAEKPLEAYDSILALFTRRLKAGCRPLDPDSEALVSPVDGRWATGGVVDGRSLVQAKGRTYAISDLLAENAVAEDSGARRADDSPWWLGGACCTLYLSPRDYHRVHAPSDGTIEGFTYVPGDLFPVAEYSVRAVDGLYTRNERVITWLRTERFGRIAVVKVGAINVGRIALAYAPDLQTNQSAKAVVQRTFDVPRPVARGDELATFELGSTVILVTENPVRFAETVPRLPLRMGVALGRSLAV